MPSIRRHVSRYKVAPVLVAQPMLLYQVVRGRADHQQVSIRKAKSQEAFRQGRLNGRIAKPVAARAHGRLAGFGMSGASRRRLSPRPPPAIARHAD